MIKSKKTVPILCVGIFITLTTTFYAQSDQITNDNTHKAERITQAVFGKSGLNLDQDTLDSINKLLYTCLHASPATLYQATQQAINLLEQRQTTIEQKISDKKIKNEYIEPTLVYTPFILRHTINHLKNSKQALYNSLPWHTKLTLALPWLDYNHEATMAARTIDWFVQHSIDYYLLDYDKLLNFYAGIKKHPLPEPLNFWDTHDARKALQMRAATLKHAALVQQWSELLTIGIQSLVLGGESMYKQWLDQDAAAKFAQLQQQLKTVQDAFQVYIKRLQDDQQTVIKTLNSSFLATQTTIQQQYQQLNTAQQQEINYLFASINVDTPLIHYLMFPIIPWDQLFENGVMSTPNNGYAWYNIYQLRLANLGWGFDSATSSFWQNALILFGTPFWNTTSAEAKNDPSQNSIFTEYVSPALSYTIEVEMQLINCSYPFFAGILFNRARWISADPERVWNYRLVGLYGTQSTPQDPTTRKINVCFAQQVITFQSDSTGKKTERITSPLEQIATDSGKQFFALQSTDITTLDKEPLTFSFTLNTAPSSVQIVFSKVTNGTKQQLYSTTISNLDTFVSRFHGIGFMSPGCQTRFTIKQPTALTYTSQQVQEFNKSQGT